MARTKSGEPQHGRKLYRPCIYLALLSLFHYPALFGMNTFSGGGIGNSASAVTRTFPPSLKWSHSAGFNSLFCRSQRVIITERENKNFKGINVQLDGIYVHVALLHLSNFSLFKRAANCPWFSPLQFPFFFVPKHDQNLGRPICCFQTSGPLYYYDYAPTLPRKEILLYNRY